MADTLTHNTAAGTAVVGKPLPHESAARQIRGQALYIDDIAEPAGTLHLAPGWCPNIAKGVIRDVDLTRVRAAPGVVAVITAKDVPGVNDCSPSIGGDPVISSGAIQFHGQVIFVVVATSRDAARKAARKAISVFP